MRHFLSGENVGLVFRRQQPQSRDLYIFCTRDIIADGYIRSDNKGGESVASLYIYPEIDKLYNGEKRKPNLNKTIIDEISRQIKLPFADEYENVNRMGKPADLPIQFIPIDVFDYIYAVLHSPAYREKYREFLKIDFPSVPYPQDAAQFWALAAQGAKLRRLHLMEGVEPQSGMADFPIAGGNEIENLRYIGDKVYINAIQYFDHVPGEAWSFYIGGYQPAQKWLKDRKGRTLEYDDIRHYQRIIRILKETGEIMREVDGKLKI